MATFPSLSPATRVFTPGEYPYSGFAGLDGSEVRVRNSNIMLGSTVQLTFAALTEAEMLLILSHYNTQQGGFLAFDLPADVWSGVAASDFRIAQYGWRYSGPPEIEDFGANDKRHNVSVQLESEPMVGATADGLSARVLALLAPGPAFGDGYSPPAAPGVALTCSAILDGGAWGDGAAVRTSSRDLTVLATLTPGTATAEASAPFWAQWTWRDDLLLF